MIKIYGGGDDGVIVVLPAGADEFDTYEKEVMWRADLVAPGGTEVMRVHAVFDGCWAFAVGQADDSIPLPEWPVRITQHPKKDFTVLLEIDAPDGTRLTNVWPTR